MQRFEAYLPEGADAPTLDELGDLLAACGVVLQPGETYRPGVWRDAASGARAVLDLGSPPIEADVQHPPRSYRGWTPLELAMQLPLVGPHWQAVEAFQFAERLLAGLPDGTRLLDSEDTQEHPDAEPGPFAWSRPRALASWERQHTEQVRSRTDLARMGRGDSLRLWRWRRERAAGAAARPDLAWPEAMVLRDHATAQAHAVCLWEDPQRACALPGGGLVLLHLPQPRLVPRSALPTGEPLPHAGAAVVAPTTWPDGLPLTRFIACDDEDWID